MADTYYQKQEKNGGGLKTSITRKYRRVSAARATELPAFGLVTRRLERAMLGGARFFFA